MPLKLNQRQIDILTAARAGDFIIQMMVQGSPRYGLQSGKRILATDFRALKSLGYIIQNNDASEESSQTYMPFKPSSTGKP